MSIKSVLYTTCIHTFLQKERIALLATSLRAVLADRCFFYVSASYWWWHAIISQWLNIDKCKLPCYKQAIHKTLVSSWNYYYDVSNIQASIGCDLSVKDTGIIQRYPWPESCFILICHFMISSKPSILMFFERQGPYQGLNPQPSETVASSHL